MLTHGTKLSNTFKTIGTNFHAGQLESSTNQATTLAIREGTLLEAVANNPISAMHGEPVYRIAKSTNQQEIVNYGTGSINLKPVVSGDTSPVDAVLVRVSGYAEDPDSPVYPSGTEAYPLIGKRQAYITAGSGVPVLLPVDATIATPDDVAMGSDINYDMVNKVHTLNAVSATVVPSKFKLKGTVITGIRLKDAPNAGQLPVNYVACNLAWFE